MIQEYSGGQFLWGDSSTIRPIFQATAGMPLTSPTTHHASMESSVGARLPMSCPSRQASGGYGRGDGSQPHENRSSTAHSPLKPQCLAQGRSWKNCLRE